MNTQDVKKKARKILQFLKKTYPDAKCHLAFKNASELLVGSILSAQCTDKRVNMITPGLFKKYPDLGAFSGASEEELQNDVRSTGFYRNKAKAIINCSREIIQKHEGKVPCEMEELVKLPGVGRKTANVIIGNYFRKPGIIVDTHIMRLSRRLGLTSNSDPVKIEFDLRECIPEKDWTFFSNSLGDHGRNVCKARKPLCSKCGISHVCLYFEELYAS
ncbi:MAG: endonuclease III [Candidatus Dadabacteria bacterium]|nr:endonuclease III [Candidatus Dadabacteria bacterium]MDE0519424.1 endonuclease III [Candidatus Dadabacteria bacterium]MDE0663671.1 endonuclease III [Candidatus Dadabacteria bacterium]